MTKRDRENNRENNRERDINKGRPSSILRHHICYIVCFLENNTIKYSIERV